MKVLVVDDLDIFCFATKKLLILENITDIDIANTGAQAIELYKSKKHDTIFLDIHLPDKSGTQILQMLYNDLITNKTLVIITTASIEQKTIDLIREQGLPVNDIIEKDVFILKKKIHQLVQNQMETSKC